MQQDPMNDFINDVLDKKQLPGLEEEGVRETVVDDIRTRLLNQIDRAILEAMPEDKIDALNAQLDSGASDEDVQRLVAESGIDVQKVTLQTMLHFRDLYLGEEA